MGRPLRIEYAGAVYHITSRGNERHAIFRADADQRHFLRFLGAYHERYTVLLHSYVLMGNHYRLLLETPRGNLVQVMQGLIRWYTRYFDVKHARESAICCMGGTGGLSWRKDATCWS